MKGRDRNMAFRAYLLIDLKKNVEQKKSNEILRKIDALDETDFVDPVDGPHDIIAMIEVPVSGKIVVETI